MNKVARFAQATPSSSVTEASNKNNTGRTFPTRRSRRGIVATSAIVVPRPCCCLSWRAMVVISARAVSIVMPSLIRPMLASCDPCDRGYAVGVRVVSRCSPLSETRILRA